MFRSPVLLFPLSLTVVRSVFTSRPWSIEERKGIIWKVQMSSVARSKVIGGRWSRCSNSLFKNLKLFYVYASFACVHVCVPHACIVYRSQKRPSDLLELGLCGLSCGCWESNLGTLEEQPLLLTADPSLYPFHLKNCHSRSSSTS